MTVEAPIWIDVEEAGRRLDELIEAVVAGRRFVITRGGNPLAMLTAYPPEVSPSELPL